MSAIFKAVGDIQQGNAAYANAKSQSFANDYNATIADNNARSVLEQANAREEQQRRQFRSLQGEAIAGAAQSGAGLDGSNADVLKQNAINNELDALTIRYEGQMQSTGLMAQAGLDRYAATANLKYAKSARTAGFMNAGADLLAGANKAYMSGG